MDRPQSNYFGAGPAQLPLPVLQQAAKDLINFQNEGLGIGEISHRSKKAKNVITDTKAHLKELFGVPDTHEVFFLQGGGTTGFSSVAANMSAAYLGKTGKVGTAAYLVTGSWSEKSAQECERLGVPTEVIFNVKKETGKYTTIPDISTWASKLDAEKHSYVYFCENETVHGVEWPAQLPAELVNSNIPIVADLSSDVLSRKIDISNYSLILAGAQKNIGLAGLTIYIIKKDLLDDMSKVSPAQLREHQLPVAPIATDYPTVVKNDSAYNTIPIFTLHIIDLVLKGLMEKGGLAKQQEENEEKARILYTALDKFPDFYNLPVDKKYRSKMNVVFTLKKDGLEDKFIEEAASLNLTGLKGHRSVGGFRASLYNAVELSSVKLLAEFVTKFAEDNQ
ncbi:Phosphoserine transaminase [Kluyveromyces marxianus]